MEIKTKNNNDLIILGHENPDVDSIVSGYLLEKILTKKGYKAKFIIPDSTISNDTLDICLKGGLNPTQFMQNIDLKDKNTKYILVDHNERNVSGEIICIIDHHPTSKEIKLEHYYNKKISSTACYICKDNEDLLNENDLKLAIIATLVDTASFHSTKSTKKDEEWVLTLCNKYNFNYDELYKIGLCLSPINDVQSASINGLKKYNFNGMKVESSYIQIENPTANKNKIQQILNILKERIKIEKLVAFVFIVHNMTEFKTMYYLITPNNVETKYYSTYNSRGSTIIPEVEKLLINYKPEEI